MGVGESQYELRPGAVPAGDPAETRDRAACRDHGGGGMLQSVRVGYQTWEVNATRVDVGALASFVGMTQLTEQGHAMNAEVPGSVGVTSSR